MVRKEIYSPFQLSKAATEVFCKEIVTKVLQKFSKFDRKTPLFGFLFKRLFKRLQHRYFSVKFVKFLRTLVLKNICETTTSKIYIL